MMVRDDAEVVAAHAVVRRHDARILAPVGAAGVHVQIALERHAVREIVADGVDAELRDPAVSGPETDEMLALGVRREGEAEASVLAEGRGEFDRIPLREVVAGGAGVDAVDGGPDVGGEFHMRAEGPDGDLRRGADREDERENVVIVKRDFHSVDLSEKPGEGEWLEASAEREIFAGTAARRRPSPRGEGGPSGPDEVEAGRLCALH